MRATIPFPFHRFYAAAAELGLLPGYSPILDEFLHDSPVLELGCGPGDVAFRLAQNHTVVGTDLDPRMIRLAQKRHGDHADCHFEVADAADLPFEDDHFSAVWASETFHHWHDREGGLREALRVLRPGGEMWVVEARADMTRREFRDGFGIPAMPGLYGGLRHLFRGHGVTDDTAHCVRALMGDAGFEAEMLSRGAWMVFVGRKPE